ncbi:SDR family NAD(P)-dependent oxidoreductase [Parerythrobacter aestuarii]|uniref:SDR family NAD(P)-dependent oxidoreductase n=1 Tax=Parerythrobacter aestuarii TaxID=3020909 RepID=UPI0024DE79C4|nr:SDR family NAD(P)-dependent oxidoreductase [Parerythrobacter aestuarii]
MTAISGKLAFVTGGASGVGLGQAKALLRRGARVVIADIMQDRLDAVCAEFEAAGTPVVAVRLDLTDLDAYRGVVDAVEAEYGPIQLLFNTAGVSQFGPLQAATMDDWRWQIDVNLYGTIHALQVFLPRMLERGDDNHIIVTASMSAFLSLPGCGIYTATKMAQRGLTESLAWDLEGTNIHVSLLCPGAVNTNIHQSLRARPAHLKDTGFYTGTEEDEARLKAVIEHGMEPERLAGYVMEAVEANRFYILPYPEFRAPLEDLQAEVMGALARPEDDPEYEMRISKGVPGGSDKQ